MTDFADLGMRIDSSSAAVAKRNLDALPASAAKAETSVSRLGASSERAGQQMRRGFGPGLQQAGYQIGDFAVQVASGQSALIALTQQGSQLLGAFGPMGAVIGAAGAVVGAMATAMLGASGSGQTLDKQLDDLDKTMARFRASTEAAAQSGAEMTEMFGSMAGAARGAAPAPAAPENSDP